MQPNIVRDSTLAPEGRRKIDWVRKNMPVLGLIEDEFRTALPFRGMRIAVSVHLEAKTAYLAEVLAAGGAAVAVTGSNPKSTKDDVVAALAESGLNAYAWYDATPEEFHAHQLAALEIEPNIVIDDGGDLVHHLHTERREALGGLYGACEETTAGVLRDSARERAGELEIPVVAVNNAMCKHLFDNRYGTGHSTMDALMRSTNRSLTGAVVVVAGYGWCGKGIAARAAGMGARVVVTEVEPIKALEAAHDGFWVMPMGDAAPMGDFFVTTTGTKHVLTAAHFETMKDGAVLANAGHFFEEIDVAGLRRVAVREALQRTDVHGFQLADGRWINVLAEGKIVNISAADGHPAEIMDMSFALQALSARYVAEHHRELAPAVIGVPQEIDNDEQRRYLEDTHK